MANGSQNVGIKNSWSLVDFARSHGQMKVTGEMTNSQTGESFKSCAFVEPGGRVTMVGFSSNLGELTPAQIKARKNELQVVELESGNFKLCASGAGAWENVDLGL